MSEATTRQREEEEAAEPHVEETDHSWVTGELNSAGPIATNNTDWPCYAFA